MFILRQFLLLVSIIFFLLGILSFFVPEPIRRFKEWLGDFADPKAHDQRREIQSTAIHLVTMASIVLTALFSWVSSDQARRQFQQNNEEFLMRNRPFVKIEPKLTNGSYYEIFQGKDGAYISFPFSVTNVGPVPAFDVRINKSIATGDVISAFNKAEPERIVVFPGDKFTFKTQFGVLGETAGKLREKAWNRKHIVEIAIDYRGPQKAKTSPYFTNYTFRFPSATQHEVEEMQADSMN